MSARLPFLAALLFATLTLALACSDDASMPGDGDAADGDVTDGDRSEMDDDGEYLPDGDLPSDGDTDPDYEQPPDWWRELPVARCSQHDEYIYQYTGVWGFRADQDTRAELGYLRIFGQLKEADVGTIQRQAKPYNSGYIELTLTSDGQDIHLRVEIPYAYFADKAQLDLAIGDDLTIQYAEREFILGAPNCREEYWMRVSKGDMTIIDTKSTFEEGGIDLPVANQPIGVFRGAPFAKNTERYGNSYVYCSTVEVSAGGKQDLLYPFQSKLFELDESRYLVSIGNSMQEVVHDLERCKPGQNYEDDVDGDLPDSCCNANRLGYTILKLKSWPPDAPPCNSQCDCTEGDKSCIGGVCVGERFYSCCGSDDCYEGLSCFDSENNWGVCE